MGWIADLSVGSKISERTGGVGVAQGLCASAVLAFSQARRKDRLGHTYLLQRVTCVCEFPRVLRVLLCAVQRPA